MTDPIDRAMERLAVLLAFRRAARDRRPSFLLLARWVVRYPELAEPLARMAACLASSPKSGTPPAGA